MSLFRLLRILSTIIRFGLDEFLLGLTKLAWLAGLLKVVFFWRNLAAPRGERLRLALESLGPVFVKFGQVLSTRRDLLPPDIADELAKLQDRVPPFGAAIAHQVLTSALGAPPEQVFATFDPAPVAAASIAQVHRATLKSGETVAVKIVRPGIEQVIAKDVQLLYTAARLVQRFFVDGRRLRPVEVVDEFASQLFDELDMVREAANASQLRRNFEPGTLLYVPQPYFDYCSKNVLVIEWVDGLPVTDLERIKAAGIDLKKLSQQGVEIFYTQVFRDAYFHADMHPGNIMVKLDGTYTGVDFGIMGTLNEVDKDYLAQNFMAFFNRDYRKVAIAHIESGWVPAHTRVDEFESAIRSVCEPIFGKPLRDINFGKVLLRLFDVSRRFGMVVQPQLVLLQKTLLQIEGLGRQLDPDLDLVPIAKPILKRWLDEQNGPAALRKALRDEAPYWAHTLPQLPRLVHATLTQNAQVSARLEAAILQLNRTQRFQTAVLWFIAVLIALMVMGYLVMSLEYFNLIGTGK